MAPSVFRGQCRMSRLRAHNISVSFDGYMAGPGQTLEEPLGRGGEAVHDWIFRTRSWKRMVGESGGEAGVDEDFIARGEEGIGATIMGRNMFGPVRGPWPDANWRGWWGDNPPYHNDVFVLTHHARPPQPMEGGTTFHFVTGGIHEALERAREAAGPLDIRLGGGALAIQQYLREGLVDELHVAITPVLLGAGERLFDRLDDGPDGYRCEEWVASDHALHARFVKE